MRGLGAKSKGSFIFHRLRMLKSGLEAPDT